MEINRERMPEQGSAGKGCAECGKSVAGTYPYTIELTNVRAFFLCCECLGKLRHALRNAAWPIEGVTIRMNKNDDGTDDGTVDEVIASDAEIHFEQMGAGCYWLMVQKDGARLDIDFTAERDDDPNADPEDQGLKITATVREQCVE